MTSPTKRLAAALPLDLGGRLGPLDGLESALGAADDLEEEFGSRLAEGDVAELVEDEQVVALELLVEPFELLLLAAFEEGGVNGAPWCGDTEGVAQGH